MRVGFKTPPRGNSGATGDSPPPPPSQPIIQAAEFLQPDRVTSGRSQGSTGGYDAFPWGAGHGTLRWTRASEQAGKALPSQGHQCAHVM